MPTYVKCPDCHHAVRIMFTLLVLYEDEDGQVFKLCGFGVCVPCRTYRNDPRSVRRFNDIDTRDAAEAASTDLPVVQYGGSK